MVDASEWHLLKSCFVFFAELNTRNGTEELQNIVPSLILIG
jgi:hypothetical protein